MQQIIIVEGPDMSGKTEIAKAISARLKVPYFKASDEHETYLHDRDSFVKHLQYADPRVVDLLKQTGQSIIFDRAYPSEWVYSDVLRRNTDVTMLEIVDRMFASLDALIVICVRSSYGSIVDDIDPSIDTDVLQRLHERYVKFTTWTKCRNIILNVDDEDLEREVDEVVSFQRITKGRIT